MDMKLEKASCFFKIHARIGQHTMMLNVKCHWVSKILFVTFQYYYDTGANKHYQLRFNHTAVYLYVLPADSTHSTASTVNRFYLIPSWYILYLSTTIKANQQP